MIAAGHMAKRTLFGSRRYVWDMIDDPDQRFTLLPHHEGVLRLLVTGEDDAASGGCRATEDVRGS